MVATMLKRAPDQTTGEEIANAVSHGVGSLLAIGGMVYLIVQASRGGVAYHVVGASLFGATVLMLYLASTLYHALPQGPAKRLFRILEHSAIFLLIAGTYSPFALGILRGPWGWSLLGAIWALAIAGILMKALARRQHPVMSVSLYLLMGWLVVVAIDPLVDRMADTGLVWLVAGGVAYTIGVVFFALGERLAYGHFVWHLFVLAGTICHYFAVLWHAF